MPASYVEHMRILGCVVLVFCVLAVPWPAAAHGVTSTSDLSFAQTMAGNELTVIIRRAPDVPGPLQVDVIAHSPVSPVRLTLSVRAVDGTATTKGVVSVGKPGVHRVVLRVAKTGEHVLEIQGASERALLPFRVLVSQPAVWELVAYGGFSTGGLVVLGAFGAAALGRRKWATGMAATATVAILVAATTAGMSGFYRPTPPAGAAPPDPIPAAADGSWQRGRPYVNASTEIVPAQPRKDEPATVRLRLTDGATGRPVDDLVMHHDALAHLVVVSDSGFFRHIHPIRVAPGELAVRFRPDRGGTFRVYAEFERQDSGAQLAKGTFTVIGPALESRPDRSAISVRTLEKPVAGRPVTMVADAGTADLQPWLGMAGHLILVRPGADFFGHVHELRSMAESLRRTGQQPDETVARYGPRLEFTYTFDRPGRYSGWLQFARDFRIETVPFKLDVLPAEKEAAP